MLENQQVMGFLEENLSLIKKIVYDKTNGKKTINEYQDIIQSVFLETAVAILRHPEYVELDDNNKIIKIKYLSQIIVSKTFDEIRKIRRYYSNVSISVNEKYTSDIIQLSNDNIEMSFLNLETIDEIVEFLNQDDMNILIDLVNGISFAEISEKYQMKLGTVKSKINRIRKKLRYKFNNDGTI